MAVGLDAVLLGSRRRAVSCLASNADMVYLNDLYRVLEKQRVKQMSPSPETWLHVHPINPGGEIRPWKTASQRSERGNSDMSDMTIDDRPDPSAAERIGREL
jgi:hypothetical protein